MKYWIIMQNQEYFFFVKKDAVSLEMLGKVHA